MSISHTTVPCSHVKRENTLKTGRSRHFCRSLAMCSEARAVGTAQGLPAVLYPLTHPKETKAKES